MATGSGARDVTIEPAAGLVDAGFLRTRIDRSHDAAGANAGHGGIAR
jgi:hypothetical protein